MDRTDPQIAPNIFILQWLHAELRLVNLDFRYTLGS